MSFWVKELSVLSIYFDWFVDLSYCLIFIVVVVAVVVCARAMYLFIFCSFIISFLHSFHIRLTYDVHTHAQQMEKQRKKRKKSEAKKTWCTARGPRNTRYIIINCWGTHTHEVLIRYFCSVVFPIFYYVIIILWDFYTFVKYIALWVSCFCLFSIVWVYSCI